MKQIIGLFLVLVIGFVGCGEKIHTDKYDNGNVMMEYQYYHHPKNNKRIKHGWYNSYYENGEYKEVGTYKNDKKEGEWTYYFDDG